MKNKQRKTGGAFRRKNMAISLYCKDKGKAKPKTATPGRELEYLEHARKYAYDQCTQDIEKRMAFRDGVLEGIKIAESIFSCSNYEKETG